MFKVKNKKLKEWKRATNFIYVKKDGNQAIIMSKKGFENKFTFAKSIKDKKTGRFLIKDNLFPYTSRKQALKKAKEYMENN